LEHLAQRGQFWLQIRYDLFVACVGGEPDQQGSDNLFVIRAFQKFYKLFGECFDVLGCQLLRELQDEECNYAEANRFVNWVHSIVENVKEG
jgi:hypothetical protein